MAVQPLRPAAKVGVLLGGVVLAFAVAVAGVAIRLHFTQGPEAQASSGMYAFGDLVLGLALFGASALPFLALGFYWLRPYDRCWTTLSWAAVLWNSAGLCAVIAGGWLRPMAGNWALLADARIGLALAAAPLFFLSGMFAPRPRLRWTLLTAALLETGIFAGVVLAKMLDSA